MYISKWALGGGRERSLPWREGGEGEGVSVRHEGYYEDVMRTTRENAPCEATERCSRLDTIKRENSSKVAFKQRRK